MSRVFMFRPFFLLLCTVVLGDILAAPPAAHSAVQLLAPNGGETLHTGEVFTVRWQPASAVSFSLFYSTNRGRKWTGIAGDLHGDRYRWDVPPVFTNRNKPSCLLKVVGYGPSGKKVGAARSRKPFRIKTIEVSAPAFREMLFSGFPHTIAWRTFGTLRPVGQVRIAWRSGRRWHTVGTLDEDRGSFDWTPPVVTAPRRHCQVRVTLRDAGGKKLGKASSRPFTLRPPGAALIVRDWRNWGPWSDDALWASVSLWSRTGGPVTGLSSDEFTVRERLYSPGGALLQDLQADLDEDSFGGPGFWERSVSGEKLDIVFLVDRTYSMEGDMPGVKAQLHSFLNRLQAAHVDYRWAGIRFGSAVDMDLEPFHGAMEQAGIRQWIDDLSTSGEWWLPVATHDAVMLAAGLDFRPGARKVIVVIQDSIALSVYGSFWYPIDTTAATVSATEMVLRDSGVELFYSQTLDPVHETEYYRDAAINPRAGDQQSGLGALAAAGLAVNIGWPFNQSLLPPGAPRPVTDSRYFLSWTSMIDVPSSYNPLKCRVKVTIEAPDHDHAGARLRADFSYTPQKKPRTELRILPTDETGHGIDDVACFLDAEMGDRGEKIFWQEGPAGGVVTLDDVLRAPYRLGTHTKGDPWYGYDTLRYDDIRRIKVSRKVQTLSLALDVGDRDSELAKARGLLSDLRGWGTVGRPFTDRTNALEGWLDRLDKSGIDWTEMERIKRSYIVLGGYANASHYAGQEAEAIADDFVFASRKLRDIFQRITGVEEDADDLFWWAMAEAAVRGDFPAIAELTAEEVTLNALKDYVTDDLVPYVISKIVEEIPDQDARALLTLMVDTMIKGDWQNWGEVLDAMAVLGLDGALDEVLDQITAAIVDDFQGSAQVKQLVHGMLTHLAQGGFDGMRSYLESQASSLIASLQGDRNAALSQLDAAFTAVYGELSPGVARDFMLPMVQLIARAAIEGDALDVDLAIEGLCRALSQRFIVAPYFTDPVNGQLGNLFSTATAFVPGPGTSYDREGSMSDAFYNFRSDVMEPLQEASWDALGVHDPIDDMYSMLSTLFSYLEPLGSLFDGLCYEGYPPTCGFGDRIDDFANVLDGVGLMTKAYDIFVKTGDLTDLADRMGPAVGLAFTE